MFILIDRRNLILKNDGKLSFSYETKDLLIYPNEENEFMLSNHEKERRLLCESMFILIDRRTLILKSGGKRSFSYETKASMTFILMSGMSLWLPILKRNKIIM